MGGDGICLHEKAAEEHEDPQYEQGGQVDRSFVAKEPGHRHLIPKLHFSDFEGPTELVLEMTLVTAVEGPVGQRRSLQLQCGTAFHRRWAPRVYRLTSPAVQTVHVNPTHAPTAHAGAE